MMDIHEGSVSFRQFFLKRKHYHIKIPQISCGKLKSKLVPLKCLYSLMFEVSTLQNYTYGLTVNPKTECTFLLTEEIDVDILVPDLYCQRLH